MIRKCLKCQKEFKSSHIGNRICPTCNFHNAKLAKMDGWVQDFGNARKKSLKE